MTQYLIRIWKQWRCIHDWYWDANIYGDEINLASLKRVYRSWWWCRKCEKFELRPQLMLPCYPTMREMAAKGWYGVRD